MLVNTRFIPLAVLGHVATLATASPALSPSTCRTRLFSKFPAPASAVCSCFSSKSVVTSIVTTTVTTTGATATNTITQTATAQASISVATSTATTTSSTDSTTTITPDATTITVSTTATIAQTCFTTGGVQTNLPVVNLPLVNTPVVNTPVVNTPVVNTPVVNTPVVNTPVVNTPVVNTPVVNTPVVNTPVVSTPVVSTPVVNTPVVNTPIDNTPVVNAPVVNTPVVNTPVVNTPVVSTPVVNTPVVNTPVVNTPVVNTPVVNTPVVNTPVVNTPVVNTPVVNTPVVNTPVVNTPVVNTPIVKRQDLVPGLLTRAKRGGPVGYPTRTKTRTHTTQSTSTQDVCSMLSTERPRARKAVCNACSCLGFLSAGSTTTVTSISTSTNAPITVSTTSTTTVTPTSTSTTTITQVSIVTNTITNQAATPTSTATSSASITSPVPNGIPYYYYHPLNPVLGANPPYENEGDIVDGLGGNTNYQVSGTISNINSLGSAQFDPTIALPGNGDQNSQQFGIVFQGYLFAADGPGVYIISSLTTQIDDIGLVWTGDKAYGTSWNYANSDYDANYYASGAFTFTLQENEALPITIVWLQAGGGAQSNFVITNPSNVLNTDTTPYLFSDCGSNFTP